MEHNTNLFTDASYLAVPAINFFGLPGYQQDTPPQVPQRFFEDGRQAFLLRMSSKLKDKLSKENDENSNPWFFLCGCPTLKAQPRKGIDQPQRECKDFELEPTSNVGRNQSGAPATAARDTAAAAAKVASFEQDRRIVHHSFGPDASGYVVGGERRRLNDEPWKDTDFREEEITPSQQPVFA